MDIITAENLTKKFNGFTAVDNISLSVKKGEIFGFLGPNGAGKTTTIKMIAGLLNPTSGRILVGSFDIAKQYLEAKKIIAYIPDEPFLYDKLTGREFLNFIADMYSIDGAQKNKEIDKYVELFSMKDYVDELIESYSHGMKQRVVISATLLHKPKVIVVDEPLVGLDPQTSRLVLNIFRNEVRSGTTIFISTHIISIAEEFADRIGIINDGQIVALGRVDELKAGNIKSKLDDIFFKIISEQNK